MAWWRLGGWVEAWWLGGGLVAGWRLGDLVGAWWLPKPCAPVDPSFPLLSRAAPQLSSAAGGVSALCV